MTPLAESKSELLINEYVHRIKMPSFTSSDEMMKWIVDQAIILYLASDEDNDFALLHGITSSWALKCILKYVENEEDRLESIRHQLTMLLMVYLMQGRPKLMLQKLTSSSPLPTWDEIKKKAFALRIEYVDEHVFKLIQVCIDQDNDRNEAMYKLASLSVINNPFKFLRKTFVISEEEKQFLLWASQQHSKQFL